MSVPDLRLRTVNDKPPRNGGAYVLYWMIAARRTRWNFALQHARDEARRRGVPLLVLEPLGVDYRWASDRIHAFVIAGMKDNAERLGAAYYPYVERVPGEGRGLLAALAARAALVVTDDWPGPRAAGFHLPKLVEAAGRALDVALVAVDGNGILPVADAPDAAPPSAYAFRRYLQKRLHAHLGTFPEAEPLAYPRGVPEVDPAVEARWPRTFDVELAKLPIDHGVPPVADFPGGPRAGEARLRAFLPKLSRYAEDRDDPDSDASSGLAPYLHFGHVSAHELVHAVLSREGWDPSSVRVGGDGRREGWWGLSPAAEAFLDQVITWRELGFQLVTRNPQAHRWEGLPAWARATLDAHRADERPHVYTHAQFEAAATHDPLWNAAQRQLREEGRIHNYMRMLWGKKIVEWSATPEDAHSTMFALNDRWALDGRDPNSVGSIGWVLGLHDRPWGPVRPIFGTIRWMSSENTARKLDVKAYLKRWS